MLEKFSDYDKDLDGSLSRQEFETLLVDVDKKMRSLPATAQVASQEGKYVLHSAIFTALYRC